MQDRVSSKYENFFNQIILTVVTICYYDVGMKNLTFVQHSLISCSNWTVCYPKWPARYTIILYLGSSFMLVTFGQQIMNFWHLIYKQEYVDVGDLISPMQPINVQNHHVEPSSPSDVSTCSSVFEHTEHDFEKTLLQTHENVHQNVQNKPVLS